MKVLVLVHPDMAWEGRGLPTTWDVAAYWREIERESRNFDVVYVLYGLSSWFKSQIQVGERPSFGPRTPQVQAAMRRFYAWCDANAKTFFDNEAEDPKWARNLTHGANMGYAFFRKVLANDLVNYLERTSYKPIEVCIAGGYRDQCLRLTRANFQLFINDYLPHMLGESYAFEGSTPEKLVYNPKKPAKRRNPPPPEGLQLERYYDEDEMSEKDIEDADRIVDTSGIRITRGMAPAFFARLDDRIVGIGYTATDCVGDVYFFDATIVVDGAVRGKGIGAFLAKAVLDDYRALKRQMMADYSVILRIHVVNKVMADIFRKLGLVPMMERGALFYLDPEDSDYWSRNARV